MRKIIITFKYINGTEKINSRPEGSGRKGDNYRIKKKDTGEASFIYRDKNEDEDPFITLPSNVKSSDGTLL